MPDKRKKICYSSQCLLLAFITQCSQSTQLFMRANVFPSDTCWLIEPIRLSLFISFSWDWGLISVTSRMVQAPQEHNIQLDKTAFDFQDQDASPDTNTTWAVGHAVCFHLFLARKMKKALLVSLLHGGQETRGLVEANRMQMLVVWEKGMWKEGEQADEGMGITSSLPTRQPWVLLLSWSECNRPGFFSLTTGAYEHTSSPPWERRLSRQSQCLCLIFFFYCPFLLLICVSVSSCPRCLSYLCFLAVWLFISFFTG